MRERAIALAELGYRVFRLRPGSKLPAIRDFPNRATSDIESVRREWTDALGDPRDDNIGISTDDLLVLDFDVKSDRPGLESLAMLEQAGLPTTAVAETPTGGLHYVYQVRGAVANSAGKIAAGVDVRGHHGYVVGAGSCVDRGRYGWIGDDRLPAAAPQWLVDQCGTARERENESAIADHVELDTGAAVNRAVEYLKHNAEPARSGDGGNETTYRVAARVKDFAISEQRCVDLMLDHWNDRCEPPWGPEELGTIVANAYRYGSSPTGKADAAAEFQPVHILETPPPVPADWPSPTELAPFDVTGLPKREWLVDGLLARTFLSAFIAPSGAGKTQFIAQLALSVASGLKTLTGLPVIEQTAVWVWNQEDEITELKRRLAAGIVHFELDWPDIKNKLFVDSGVDRPLLLAARDKNGVVRPTKYVNRIIKHVIENRIGLVVVDPFVEFHEANENDNVEIRTVASILRRIAVEGDCAVLLCHHTKKPDRASSDGFAGSADSGRGASSLQGVTRVMASLYQMGPQEAKRYPSVTEANRHKYVRLDGAKSNLSLAAGGGKPAWFERVSVELGPGGEHVGVLKPVDLVVAEKRTRVDIDHMAVAVDIADTEGLPANTEIAWVEMERLLTERLAISPSRLRDLMSQTDGGEHLGATGKITLTKRRGKAGSTFVWSRNASPKDEDNGTS